MLTAELNWEQYSARASGWQKLDDPCWYAIQTRCRFEKKVAAQLQNKGVETFVPLVSQVHRWSDRRQVVEVPLFPGYGFVRISDLSAYRLRVLQTAGLTSFVTVNGMPVPVPEKQIEDVRLLLSQGVSSSVSPFVKAGQRVRIRGGCLDGIEGIFLQCNQDSSLVISIAAIQRSLAIRVENYDLELI
jgi:transcription antitermination factor NusG